MAPSIPARTLPIKLNQASSVRDSSAYAKDTLESHRTDHTSATTTSTYKASDGNVRRNATTTQRRLRGPLSSTNSLSSRNKSLSYQVPDETIENEHHHEQIEGGIQDESALTPTLQQNTISSSMNNNPYGGYGMGSPYSYGMGMNMGMGMGMGMPLYGGMMGPNNNGILSNLNQFLFSFQSVIFSLSQAMQIVGMNTQALRQMYGQALTMVDNVLSTLQELQTIHINEGKIMTEEDEKRRRRLKAIRICLVAGGSYLGYIAIMRWLKKRREWARKIHSRPSSNFVYLQHGNDSTQMNQDHFQRVWLGKPNSDGHV